MKTIQELYKEVIASEELKKEFMDAAKDEENGQKNVEEFLKKYGCDATFDELQEFFKEKSDDELGEEELEAVAGGKNDAERIAGSVILGLASLGLSELIGSPCR